MDKDEGHVSPTPSPPQLAARVPDKMALADDEGIGGCEDTTPRPGSSQADSGSPDHRGQDRTQSPAKGDHLNPSLAMGDDSDPSPAEEGVRTVSPPLSAPRQSPQHSLPSPGPSPRDSPHQAHISPGSSPRDSPQPAPQQADIFPGPSPRDSPHQAHISPGPSPRDSPHQAHISPGPSPRDSPQPAPQQANISPGPSPRDSPQPAPQQANIYPGPSPRDSPQPAPQQANISPGPSPRDSPHQAHISPGSSPRDSPQHAPQQAHISPGRSPRDSPHQAHISPGSSPRDSPQHAPQQAHISPGPSPRDSPPHAPLLSPQRSHPASVPSPLHSPQASPGNFPGQSPRLSARPASGEDVGSSVGGNSPQHSPQPSPRHPAPGEVAGSSVPVSSPQPSPQPSFQPSPQPSPRHAVSGGEVIGSPQPSPGHSASAEGTNASFVSSSPQLSPRYSPSMEDAGSPIGVSRSPEPSPRSPSRESASSPIGKSSLPPSPGLSPARQGASSPIVADSSPRPSSPIVADSSPRPSSPIVADSSPRPSSPIVADSSPRPSSPIVADSSPRPSSPIVADSSPRPSSPIVADSSPRPSSPIVADSSPRPSSPIVADSSPRPSSPIVADSSPRPSSPIVADSSPRPRSPQSSHPPSPQRSGSGGRPGSSVGDSSLEGLAEWTQSSPARTSVCGSSLGNSAASSPARTIVVTADVEPANGVSEIDAVADVNEQREPADNGTKAAPARFVRRCGGGGEHHHHHHHHHQSNDSGSSRRTPHHPPRTPGPPKRPKSAAVRKRQAPPPDVSEDSFRAASPSENNSNQNKTTTNNVLSNNDDDITTTTITTNLDNEFFAQLQRAMSALQDYQTELRSQGAVTGAAGQRGGVTGSQEANDLRQTLRTLTRLCETCSSNSQSLGAQLRAARQLSDSIGQDLNHRLEESPELKDWIPPGLFVTDNEEARPEVRQAAQRERVARAAEARAAVVRASLAMQAKSEELARAEEKMAETEMEAVTAREAAEDAVRHLEATQAAEEAKRKHEEAVRREEEEEDAGPAQDEGEDLVDEEEDWSHTQEDEQDEDELNLMPEDEGTTPLDDDRLEPEEADRDRVTSDEDLDFDEQHDDTLAPDVDRVDDDVDRVDDDVDRVDDDVDRVDDDEEEEGEEEEEEHHIEFTEPETELTSQWVFQEVHVVSDREDVAADQQTCPRFIYSVDSGDWDTGLGCVIKPCAKRLSRDALHVTRVHPARADLRLHDGEELISNIVQVTAHEPTTFSPFLSVSLPHCAPRMHPGREPCMRMRPLNGGGWKDLPTSDITFDDIKVTVFQEHKFVEVALREPGTLCVVLRLKRDEVDLTRQGGKAMAAADSRVTVTWPNNVVKTRMRITMGVQLLDQAVVSEVRARADMDCGSLMSCSPVLFLQGAGVKLLKPLTLSLPCPPNPAVRPQRPATGRDRNPTGRPERAVSATGVVGGGDTGGGGEGGDQRPATARPFFGGPKKVTAEEIFEDEVHVLWRKDGGSWTLLPDVDVQDTKKKDVVTLAIRVPVPRLLLLRTRTGLPPATVERMATTLEHLAAHHVVHLVLRQHHVDPSRLVLTYVSDVTMEKSLRLLADEGYSLGPPSSGDIRLREGQMVEVGFRGNIRAASGVECEGEGQEFLPRCVFYTNIPFMVRFCATEIDRFAQKGFDTYRGFAQVTTSYVAPFKRSNSSSGGLAPGAPCWQSRGMPPCFVTGKHLLAELVVSLPKPEPEPPRPLNTAPVILKSYGPINNDLMRHVAQQLAADDWRRLAPLLNVRRTRLQAILRQNVSAPAWLPVYDVLLTWSKRLPQAFDRVEILCAALTSVGRNDLAEEVRDRESSFRHEHFMSTREILLHKAFVRIARHEKAVQQWRRLALFLGISETAVLDIVSATSSARERCMQSLQRWKEEQDASGDLATVSLLSRKLRLCRYRALARDIESIR